MFDIHLNDYFSQHKESWPSETKNQLQVQTKSITTSRHAWTTLLLDIVLKFFVLENQHYVYTIIACKKAWRNNFIRNNSKGENLYFRNATFTLLHAQGFYLLPLLHKHAGIIMHLKRIFGLSVSSKYQEIYCDFSHLLDNLKVNNEDLPELDREVAPNGRKIRFKRQAKNNFCVCPVGGTCIRLTILTIKQWIVSKAVVKNVLIQTEDAWKDVSMNTLTKPSFVWTYLASACRYTWPGYFQRNTESFIQISFQTFSC